MSCRAEYSVTRCWSNNKQRGTLTLVLVLLLDSTQNVHINPRQRSESLVHNRKLVLLTLVISRA